MGKQLFPPLALAGIITQNTKNDQKGFLGMLLAPRASKTRRKTSRKPLRNVFYALNTRLQRNNRAQRQKTPLPSNSAVSFPISELLPTSGKVAATWETDWECIRDMGTAETRSLAPEQSEEPSSKARKTVMVSLLLN